MEAMDGYPTEVGLPVAPSLLTMPDGATPDKWGGDMSSMPMPDSMSADVWEALCQRMMKDIHRNHMMTPEEKEKHLRVIKLPVSGGEDGGREVAVVEDPTGVYAVGATGSVLWPAALCMIEKLDKLVPNGSNKMRVVELGAGLGCIGNFLQRHKGCYVALTDVTEGLPLLQRNVDENFSNNSDGPEVLPLRWGDEDQLSVLKVTGSYDMVVGSDITYRPEHIDALLRTICSLLKPGGKIHISLQDRPGEAQSFRDAIARNMQLEIVDFKEVEAGKTGMQTALEEHVELWGDQAAVKEKVQAVFLFELAVKSDREPGAASRINNSPFPGLPASASEVEAEFFRMTGITPDETLRPAFADIPARAKEKTARPAPSTNAPKKGGKTELGSKSQAIKNRIITDYLERGLGAMLCDIDEDVRHALQQLPRDDQPRTDGDKRRFVEEFYGHREKNPDVPTNSLKMAGAEANTALAEIQGLKGVRDAIPEPAATKATAASESSGKENCKVKKCHPGLDWDVTINEDSRLCATVNFDDDTWEALQGSSHGSSKSFREAVSFELSDQELRVTYMASAVLELQLPQAVEPSTAVAKLSSKLRRVTVNVQVV